MAIHGELREQFPHDKNPGLDAHLQEWEAFATESSTSKTPAPANKSFHPYVTSLVIKGHGAAERTVVEECGSVWYDM